MDARPDMARNMRAAADETAHALKGSLATIQSSIEPLRRAVPLDDIRARRAIELIEAALSRLNDLVEAVHQRDCAIATALEGTPATGRH